MKYETKKCKRCAATFECKMKDIANCKCAQVSLSKETTQFLKATFWNCLCEKCLREVDEKIIAIKGEAFPMPNELKEGVHFYMDKGLFVFTERYHQLRGTCCQSGCRHCAYGFNKE